MNIHHFFWVIFALLDPDLDPATQINADLGESGSAILPFFILNSGTFFMKNARSFFYFYNFFTHIELVLHFILVTYMETLQVFRDLPVRRQFQAVCITPTSLREIEYKVISQKAQISS